MKDGNTITVNNKGTTSASNNIKSSSGINIAPATLEKAYVGANNASTYLGVAALGTSIVQLYPVASFLGVIAIGADITAVGIAAYQGKKGYISKEKAAGRMTFSGLSAVTGGIGHKAALVKDFAVKAAAEIVNFSSSIASTLFK